MILALILSAQADPIRTTQLPQTIDFSYDYPTVPASGVTTFTFESAARDTSTLVCSDLPGCMDGLFSTGNGGSGDFSTDLVLDNCSPAPPPGMPATGINLVPQTCDVIQILDLVYAGTGANYLGEGTCGTADVDVAYACAGAPFFYCIPTPIGILNRTYTFAPEPLEGTVDAVFFGAPVSGVWEQL